MDRRAFSISVLGSLSMGAPQAWAQSSVWPSNRVSLVIPFPAGAATDITGRVIGSRLSQLWGQPVVTWYCKTMDG